MHEFVKLSHSVSGAWWNDKTGKWKIKVTPNGNEKAAFYDECEILINATGVLKYVILVPMDVGKSRLESQMLIKPSSHWKWPAIPGVEKFKNKVHSAAWDDSVDLDDKVVGMIGNGSSAVQIIPAIFSRE